MNDWATVVDAVAKAEGQIVAVLVRDGRCSDRASGKLDALARRQRAARDHAAVHILCGRANDLQFEIAIAQEQPVARLDIFGQVRVVNGDLVARAEDLARGQGERRAGLQRH
jgi:hypothetical protein